MDATEQHEFLIQTGLDLHEARDYQGALPYFERAYSATPECVAAQYNLANTLHMLGHNDRASSILKTLLDTTDDVFRQGCPLGEEPGPFKLDALFLMFLTTLLHTEDWKAAFPFAQQHLSSRCKDLESVWSEGEVQFQIDRLRSEYSQP